MQKDLWIIIERLGDIILKYNEGCIVEIGAGQSTFMLSGFAKRFNRMHYACDRSDRTCNWLKEKIKNDTTVICEMDSFDFMKLDCFKNMQIALFLIDGNHKNKYVSKEADFLISKLVPGGVGFIHDTFIAVEYYEAYVARGARTEPYLTRLELENRKDIWTFTWPYTANECGLTMIMKKEENRPFYRE